MLRWFPRLQVATACFSCSPPDLNFLDPYFILMYIHYNHCHRATAHFQLYIYIYTYIYIHIYIHTSICRYQWPRGLRRRSSAARLLRLWVRIPPEAWMFVCCECCALSGRGLCDGLITRPEESYRLWRVVVCDQETSKMRRLKPATGLWKI